jgi:hypothetical protein
VNILPAPPKPQPSPQFDGLRNAPGRREEGQSFGEVMAAALQAGRPIKSEQRNADEPGVAIDGTSGLAAGLRSALRSDPTVEIGEDAVRFDARPVVAHSFMPEASVGASQPARIAPAAPELSGQIVERQLDLQRALAKAAPHCETGRLGRLDWTASAPLAARLLAPPKGAVTRAAESQVPLRVGPPPFPEGPRPADHAVSSAAAKAEVRTEISLALAGDEVLVTVRGVELTADEEEALADELRGLLSSTDFGGRALRIVTSRRT